MAPRVAPATSLFARLSSAIARRQYGAPMVEATRVYARHPRLLRALSLYNRAVEKRGRVPHALGELAVLKAATVVECEFCIDLGSALVRRTGLSDEQLLALHRAHASGLFDADQLLVIDYARAMSTTPSEVTDELAAAVAARWGDEGLIELTHLVAWENARARTNQALGVGAGGFSEGRVCALPERAADAPEAAGAPAPEGAGAPQAA
jgi:AhpD family alkylhydroperoxidase